MEQQKENLYDLYKRTLEDNNALLDQVMKIIVKLGMVLCLRKYITPREWDLIISAENNKISIEQQAKKIEDLLKEEGF